MCAADVAVPRVKWEHPSTSSGQARTYAYHRVIFPLWRGVPEGRGVYSMRRNTPLNPLSRGDFETRKRKRKDVIIGHRAGVPDSYHKIGRSQGDLPYRGERRQYLTQQETIIFPRRAQLCVALIRVALPSAETSPAATRHKK